MTTIRAVTVFFVAGLVPAFSGCGGDNDGRLSNIAAVVRSMYA